MIHLDTSFLIRAIQGNTPAGSRILDWMEREEPLAVSAVVWAEFLCGPLVPDDLRLAVQIVGTPIDFTAEHATIAARLFNTTGRRRGSMVDSMIAAAAIAERAELATENTDDFRGFAGHGLVLV